VYPIALFSWDRPLVPASNIHLVALFDRQILRFEFDAIQLNMLDCRKFLRTPNPAAGALMIKMQIAASAWSAWMNLLMRCWISSPFPMPMRGSRTVEEFGSSD